MPRGRYKRHEYDSDVHIPRTTSYNKQKRQHMEIGSTCDSTEPEINISNRGENDSINMVCYHFILQLLM